MNETVLVIDDHPQMLALLRAGLEREGFKVIATDSGKEGIRETYESRPDVIILDIIMPEMDGWEACRRVRQMCDVPIIMLSALSDRPHIVKGLEMGADDYLTKPFSLDELTARIRSVLRRSRGDSGNAWRTSFNDGNLRVDLASGTVERRGEAVHLTPTESRLLMYLVGHRGRVVPHRELLIGVWGPEYAEDVQYLSVYIRYLRQKVEDDPSNPHYVRTRWRVGYHFLDGGA